jgi:hypothetical protein
MKHAGNAALDRLEPLLAQIRRRGALAERSRGVFYRGGRAFLHFHEHGQELFADLRAASEFERLAVTGAAERRSFLIRLDAALASGGAARRG